MRVLLIEDNEDDVYLIREILADRKEARFDVESVDRLDQGLKHLVEGRIDIVLLDLSLPDSHGLGTFEKTHAAGKDLPIIVLTGLDDEGVAMQAMRAGAQDYLVKNRMDGDLLVRAIRYAVERKGTEAALRKSEAQFRQAQKMESVGRLAGGIAHDFNNLLTVINGYTEMILPEMEFGTIGRKWVEEVKEAGHRAATLTRQLLAFSRQQVLEPQVLDVNAATQNIAKFLRRLIGEDINLVLCLGAEVSKVHMDPGQLDQVIMNLGVNARDAMAEGGELTIETRDVVRKEPAGGAGNRLPPGRYVVLTVRDTGCGMTEEVQTRIFEPFFTTKEPGKGTGLGLATVYGIVNQSGGHIEVLSKSGQGTTFNIYLPGVEDEVSGLREPAPLRPEHLRGTETILLVEDDEMVRKLAQTILEGQGYTVLEARNANEALHIGQEHAGPIHLLLTDTIMPGLNGPELAERFLAGRPGTNVLFTSGYTDRTRAYTGRSQFERCFLQKPFTAATLTRKIREILDSQQKPVAANSRSKAA